MIRRTFKTLETEGTETKDARAICGLTRNPICPDAIGTGPQSELAGVGHDRIPKTCGTLSNAVPHKPFKRRLALKQYEAVVEDGSNWVTISTDWSRPSCRRKACCV